MTAVIHPRRLSGTLRAIPSKSYAHRILICAALGDAPTAICCDGLSDDILTTIQCLKGLGAQIDVQPPTITVTPIQRTAKNPLLDCRECGAALRFLLPVTCALGANARFTGSGRLPQRPLSPLCEVLTAHDIRLSPEGTVPLCCDGALTPGSYIIDGGISSQFVSGLLLALPLLQGDSVLEVTDTVESAGYVDITLDVLSQFGIVIRHNKETSRFEIPGGQHFRTPGQITVEGDWSNAAVWLAAGAIGGQDITVENLNMQSLQADRAILKILRQYGLEITAEGDTVTVSGEPLWGIQLVGAQTPDLIPVLSAVAAAADGRTEVIGARRLRLKESDRIAAICATLKALGGEVTELEDGLSIVGHTAYAGGTADSFGDHRIVMMAALLTQLCRNPVTISGAEAINKSYPDFFRHFEALGGQVEKGG